MWCRYLPMPVGGVRVVPHAGKRLPLLLLPLHSLLMHWTLPLRMSTCSPLRVVPSVPLRWSWPHLSVPAKVGELSTVWEIWVVVVVVLVVLLVVAWAICCVIRSWGGLV